MSAEEVPAEEVEEVEVEEEEEEAPMSVMDALKEVRDPLRYAVGILKIWSESTSTLFFDSTN